MDLLMIRHGHDELTSGRERELSVRGRAQADALVDRLRGIAIDEIYSATTVRARQTAGPLAAALNHEVRLDSRLNEIWTDRELELSLPPPRERRNDLDRPGAESWQTFLVRVSAFLSDLCAVEHGARRIVAVTHSGFIDAMHEVLSGATGRIELEVAHTGLTGWSHLPDSSAGQWILRHHNDTGPLAASATAISTPEGGGSR
jgi:broad specificity phosphatase PhoE